MPNFGDQISVDIFRYFGYFPEYSRADHAEVFSTGSILQQVISGKRCVVIGSGFLASDVTIPELSGATIISVRGPRTAEMIPCEGNISLGDPALLAKTIFGDYPKKYEFGIVPHHVDYDSEIIRNFVRDYGLHCINPSDQPGNVVKSIASCRKIFSSSLHGLIVADSYGIPAVHFKLNEVYGDHFKFDDYHASISLTRNRYDLNDGIDFEKFLSCAVKSDAAIVQLVIDGINSSFRKLHFELIKMRVGDRLDRVL